MQTFAACTKRDDSSGDFTMTDQSKDIDAIKQFAEDWRSGWLAGDADALLSLYADNVKREHGGTWKIARLIDNSDRAPASSQ